MAQVLADTAQYSVKIAGKTFEVLSFDAYDEMSRLFRFTLTLRCDDPQVDIKGLLRKKVDIHLTWQDKEKWWFGIVASMSQVNAGTPGHTQEEGDYGEYVAEVVPSFWVMSQKTNCKIFQYMTVKDILEDVLDKRGMAGKYHLKLTKGYEQREYCVQYRETDFAFLSRLMEEEGIFYWFWHDPDEKKDILTISDAVSGYAGCWPEDTVEFKKATGVLSTDVEYLSALTYEENAYTGKVGYRDWNYRDPRKPPAKINATAEQNHDLDIYDYHLERYRDDGRGQFLAQMAVEEQAALRETLAGSGNFRSLGAGHRFTLKKAYRDDLNRDWVVVSCTHHASQQGGGVDYHVSFTAIPAGTVFRPLPRTPRPTISMQTAIVVGPQGAEIYMDQYGRAKVQFHWDLDHEYEPESSCWIRVAQPYAGINEGSGDKHGFQWHPLIGDEVVVDFLEADPDNPLIVGSVYNYINMQPIKPEWLVSSCILSPYQHSLVFDDKYKFIKLNTPYPHTLMMSDPARHTHLTTKYLNALKLQDPHGDFNNIPHVILETGGAEQIKLEDNDTKLGNNIQMKTADGHIMHFAEGPDRQGIITASRKANQVVLDDKTENITVQTTNGHRVLMDDKNETIVVTSRDQHRIEINDKAKYIAVSDESGQHRFTIDIAGKQLTIATDTGSIAILAPEGQVRIDADSVAVTAKKSVSVECDVMSTKAKSEVTVEAPQVRTEANSIQEKAAADIKMEANNVTSKATMQNQTEGAAVNSEASGVNTIKGFLVKIN
jgi:type VI secretion system VgrG family protein